MLLKLGLGLGFYFVDRELVVKTVQVITSRTIK